MLALSISAFGANVSLPKSYTVRYTHNFGRINGFVQIPKGGQFNTTSERRPTFDELDIKNINYPELFIGAKWDNFGIYYGMKYKSFKGNATLNEDLKTHDLQLRKGDKISSKHLYAFHNLGFSYDFKLNSLSNLDCFMFSKYLDENIKIGFDFGNLPFCFVTIELRLPVDFQWLLIRLIAPLHPASRPRIFHVNNRLSDLDLLRSWPTLSPDLPELLGSFVVLLEDSLYWLVFLPTGSEELVGALPDY